MLPGCQLQLTTGGREWMKVEAWVVMNLGIEKRRRRMKRKIAANRGDLQMKEERAFTNLFWSIIGKYELKNTYLNRIRCNRTPIKIHPLQNHLFFPTSLNRLNGKWFGRFKSVWQILLTPTSYQQKCEMPNFLLFRLIMGKDRLETTYQNLTTYNRTLTKIHPL